MMRQADLGSTKHGQPAEDSCAFAVRTPKAPTVLLTVVASATLAGCTGHGAPSYVLFGAYFPGWMFCAVAGIIGAIAARGVFVAVGLDGILPFQLFVCASVGLLVATSTWLVWFGQ